jgi:hypothetical protein
VAHPVAFDTQALEAAGVPVPVNCVVDPAHTIVVPLKAGCAFTVIIVGTVRSLLTQPAALTASA